MKKVLTLRHILLRGLFPVITLTTLLTSVTYAYYTSITKEENLDLGGDIGLREYFYNCDGYIGDGTSTKPYIITRPIHFYNLTRLQNLGLFSDASKAHFQIGYPLNTKNDSTDTNLYVFKSDTTVDDGVLANSYTTTLDMSDYSKTLLSIGNEATPFYGTYDGSNINIKGLTIHSSPEDVGVFGYVDSGAKVENCLFSNLKVYNDGYNTSSLAELYPELTDGSKDVTDSIYASDAVLKFNNTSLYNDLTSTSTYTFNATEISDGTFTATFPTSFDTSTKFYIKSTSSSILLVDKTNNTIDIDYATLIDNTDNNNTFITTDKGELDFRISLIASKSINSISYAKVLSTYLVKFFNNIVNDTPTITMKVYLDYLSSDEDEKYTNYSHKNNVGYLVGHTDGTVLNSYVYNETGKGGIYLNSSDSTKYSYINSESETGLIGEIGVNINNGFNPSEMFDNSGDTGVVNFTNIYNTILGDNTIAQIEDGPNGVNVYAYTPVTGNVFMEFLREDHRNSDGTIRYITPSTNKIDFSGLKVIADTDDTDRGLGIFTLTTGEKDNNVTPYDEHFLDGFGSYSVTKDTTNAFSEFYYTTGEYVPDNTTSNTPNYSNWGEYGGRNYILNNMVDMPTYVDSSTWNQRYERRSNYIIRCPFSSSMNGYYFYNTDSDLLKEYFTYKLHDKRGDKIDPGSKEFGVMVKDVSATGIETNITSLNSYLTIQKSSSTFSTLTSNDVTYATSAISFKISNDTGANVTVMASNVSGSGSYLSVYDKTQAIGDSKLSNAVDYPLYTTYIPSNNDFKYFNYNLDGTTDTRATIVDYSSTPRLFAHTFSLPKGDYLISSPNGSIYIYYVAAQGQTEGNAGETEIVYTPYDVVDYIDFLLYNPSTLDIYTSTYTDPKDGKTKKVVGDTYRAFIYTELYFNNSVTTYEIYTDPDTHKLYIEQDTNLTKAVILNKNYTNATYDYYFNNTLIEKKQFYFYTKA